MGILTASLLFALIPQDGRPVGIGDVVPDLEMTDIEGNAVHLADFRADAEAGREGKPVVILSWSSLCPTGRQFMPKFTEIADWCREHDVGFVAVCAYGDSDDQIRQARQRMSISYPVVNDANRRVRETLGFRTVTQVFVLDGEGRLRYRGAIDNSDRSRRGGNAEYVCYATSSAQAILDGTELTVTETRSFG